MDWIRQNTFLATFGGIVLAGVLGFGYFLFSNWKAYSAALEEFDSTHSSLVALENSSLHPDPENLKKVKERVDAYEKSVNDLFTKLEGAQKPLPTDVDVTKFGEKVEAAKDPFLAKAKEQGVIVGDSFWMGMDEYRTGQPADDPEILKRLEWQLGGIAELVDLALEADIKSIDQFRRYKSKWEDPKAAPKEEEPTTRRGSSSRNRSSSRGRGSRSKAPKTVKMADVTESTRLRLRVTGEPDSINNLINLISNNKNYHYWVRWVKIANENPSGPLRNQDYTPIPITDDPDAEDVPEKAAPFDPDADPAGADEFKPPMRDVFPILGMEKLKAEMVVDIIRFREPPAPPEKKKTSRTSRNNR